MKYWKKSSSQHFNTCNGPKRGRGPSGPPRPRPFGPSHVFKMLVTNSFSNTSFNILHIAFSQKRKNRLKVSCVMSCMSCMSCMCVVCWNLYESSVQQRGAARDNTEEERRRRQEVRRRGRSEERRGANGKILEPLTEVRELLLWAHQSMQNLTRNLILMVLGAE